MASPRRPGFPPATSANEDGIVLVGGELSPAWLLEAYANGIFPWPLSMPGGHLLAWFSPDPRAVLEFDEFYVSRRLARRLRKGEFTITLDQQFSAVIAACAEPRRPGDGTWITRALRRAYEQLFQQGFAHSVEVWREGLLVGGLYGVAIGGYFSAESMFSRRTDASKAALATLLPLLNERGFQLFDIQVLTEHTASLGAKDIPRSEFLRRLKAAQAAKATFPPGLLRQEAAP